MIGYLFCTIGQDFQRVTIISVLILISFLNSVLIFITGKVGDWKGWFTVTQSEIFDKLIADRLKTSNFSFKYSL